ncbi:MAG: peptidoglycan DD-metalloendopeptidase family protein [Oscillospiraceae bacterium]|nr:peptidoglycan DD-metalloendopeptidase family protein [Oscillospiraceae bacterium]
MKTAKRIVAIILIIILVLGIVASTFGMLFATKADAATSAEIKNQITNLENTASSLAKRKVELEQELVAIAAEQGATVEKKVLMDQQIDVTRQEIANTTEVLQQYTLLIANQQSELDRVIEQEQQQLESFSDRIRAMEENGSTSYIAIVLGASSFSDLLTRIDMISEIAQYDNRIIERMAQMRSDITLMQDQLEISKSEQRQAQQLLEQQEETLVQQVDQAVLLLKELENQEEEFAAMLEYVEQQEADVANAIDRKIAEYDAAVTREEEERRRLEALAAAGKDYVDDSDFYWPSYCNIITSVYGMRTHPVTGVYKLHTGVDIGSSYGSKIYAAKSGSVITSGSNYAYGEYVVIYHGNGVSTLYAHMSERAVSEGDYVLKGDVIGYVGSSGYSTGAHLHFEIRVNGTYMNPISYYPNKSFVYV